MRKTWLVLVHELVTTFTRPSFLLVAIGIPLASMAILALLSANRLRSAQVIDAVLTASDQTNQAAAEGYVDLSGLIKTIPPSIPAAEFQAFPDEAAAKAALASGVIRDYYIIPADYLSSGKIIFVRTDFNPIQAFEQSGAIQWILKVNLLGGDAQLANQIDQPLQLQTTLLEPDSARDQNNPLTFFVPYAITLIFYLVILMPASLLLSSISKEKENRVLEMLMVSTSPGQMLAGKTIGLGIAGLFQAAVWVSTAFIALRSGSGLMSIPAGLQLPASILAWGLVYFLLGYAVYASLMAAVGALVPNLRESTQATFIIILPMMIPLMMISVIIDNPNGPLAVIFSLFPLTSPITMMTRLAATSVPPWQLLCSVVLLAVSAVYINRIVANLFRAQVLLSGQPFQIRRFLASLTGRQS